MLSPGYSRCHCAWRESEQTSRILGHGERYCAQPLEIHRRKPNHSCKSSIQQKEARKYITYLRSSMLWGLARSLVGGHSEIQVSRPSRAVLDGGRGVDMSSQGIGGRDRRLRRGWRLSPLTAELRGAAA